MLLPIWQIENWIWKIFCPGKEDCEKLNNLHPKNYPPLCMRFFVHRSAARTTPPHLCNLHKRLDPLLLVNVQIAQTCEKCKKSLDKFTFNGIIDIAFVGYNFYMVDIAQLVRVPGCGPGGHGFEPDYPPHFFKTHKACFLF